LNNGQKQAATSGLTHPRNQSHCCLLPVNFGLRCLKGEQAVYEACRLAWKQTGVNPLNLIDISDLLAESLLKRRTARSEK